MADIDDLLDDEEGEASETPKESAPDQKAWSTMRRKLEKAQKEVEELRAFKTQTEAHQRTSQLSEAFSALGLKAKHAEFYPADADTGPEAIKAWAVDKELLMLEEGQDEESPAVPKVESAGFTPTAIGEGAPLGSKRYSFEEWEELLASDPPRAMKVWNEGKVQRNESPGGTVFVGRDR